MNADIQKLNEQYEEKLKKLNEQKKVAIKQAKEKAKKQAAAERSTLRKKDAHIKILLGGFIMSEIKAGRIEGDFLTRVIGTVKTEKDKKLLTSLKAAILPQSAKKPKN